MSRESESAAAAVAEEPLPPIRVINFEKFARLQELPRYPDDRAIVEHLDDIDQDDSFLIFISHCWIAGWSGSKDWRGRPHPDNLDNSKFKLIVNAVSRTWKILSPRMKQCYIWLDFGCIDQSKDPAGELKQLNKIVESMDCILTPILDPAFDTWDLKDVWRGMFVAYEAENWKVGDHAYLNRAWCRMEMFYAANIPLRRDSATRAPKFTGGQQFATLTGRRPHILYGTREDVQKEKSIKIIEPLHLCLLEQYSPLKGNITVTSDYDKIKSLMDDLKPFMKTYVVGYEGERNEIGKFHGKGIYCYDDGSSYEGSWNNGKQHGLGKKTFSNGTTFEGEFMQNKRHGSGKMMWANGDVYNGDFRNNQKCGRGVLKIVNPDGSFTIYEGEFFADKRHGKGKSTETHAPFWIGTEKAEVEGVDFTTTNSSSSSDVSDGCSSDGRVPNIDIHLDLLGDVTKIGGDGVEKEPNGKEHSGGGEVGDITKKTNYDGVDECSHDVCVQETITKRLGGDFSSSLLLSQMMTTTIMIKKSEEGYWKEDVFVGEEVVDIASQLVALADITIEASKVDSKPPILCLQKCIFFKQGTCRNGDSCKFLHKA